MGTSIHFPAAEEPDGERKVLRLRLNGEAPDLADSLLQRSSSELRSALGCNYAELATTAQAERRSISAQAISILSERLLTSSEQLSVLRSPTIGTYRGGKGDFFHDLFPYLEAFSPGFVRDLTDRYAPNAKVLLDPFGGCGTAPLTFAYDRPGKRIAYYCELNPLLQRIVSLKEWLRSLPSDDRVRLRKRISEMRSTLPQQVSRSPRHDLLDVSYDAVFGQSSIFPSDTFDQVLRVKTLIEHLRTKDAALSNVLEIAVLASIVPASNMQRAGDLRRKRPDERRKISSDLLDHVFNSLERIEKGLESFEQMATASQLLTEDVRSLSTIPSIKADLIITSPPYLNGTNYFRNTKVELWFLRVLNTSNDLARLRDQTITAGINDVRGVRGRSHPPDDLPECMADCVEQLEDCAYDRRIPLMVRWYAFDLEQAIKAAMSHTKRGTKVFVDIGDSIYSGVRVPTDKLVADILSRNGCEVLEEILIRQRMARQGRRVHQVCIVAEARGSSRTRVQSRKPNLRAWQDFQSQLPHTEQPYCKRNWGHPWHSICSFQGKLKPAIAKFLTDAFVPAGGAVLDPFAGVGTIPFEAASSGKVAYGFDLSPAAIAISKAKVSTPDVAEIEQRMETLEAHISKASAADYSNVWQPGFNRPLADYYHAQTLREILAARSWFADQHPWGSSDAMLLACAMHVLHGNRPYALSRRSHPVTPYAPTGETIYKPFIDKLREKTTRVLSEPLPTGFQDGFIYEHDATSWWPSHIYNLDAVITSPPFFDSTRFFMANWIRLWFAGWTEHDFKSGQRIFLEEQQKRSLTCYEPIFRQSKERLGNGGVLLMHLGKSKKCNMGVELQRLARKWFSKSELFDESVAHCESHGIRDKGTVTDHQYLLLY
jgi:DNA modification methylase